MKIALAIFCLVSVSQTVTSVAFASDVGLGNCVVEPKAPVIEDINAGDFIYCNGGKCPVIQVKKSENMVFIMQDPQRTPFREGAVKPVTNDGNLVKFSAKPGDTVYSGDYSHQILQIVGTSADQKSVIVKDLTGLGFKEGEYAVTANKGLIKYSGDSSDHVYYQGVECEVVGGSKPEGGEALLLIKRLDGQEYNEGPIKAVPASEVVRDERK